MPLYVYHCEDCEQDFERMVRFSETDQPQQCPHCGSTETAKRITTFASRFSGSTASSQSASSCSGGYGRFT